MRRGLSKRQCGDGKNENSKTEKRFSIDRFLSELEEFERTIDQ